MSDAIELVIEFVLLIGFILLVHLNAPMRFIFGAGVLYLAAVIRHHKDGGGAMRDTIYRDDAIRVASGYCHPANVAKELAKLPSAQPEIIRCKECMYYSNGECDSAEMWQNLYGETTEVECINRHPNDFCSYAERRVEHGKN